MNAVFSDCGRYRYTLSRDLTGMLRHPSKDRRILWVMLNPSTATAVMNDPTITRCEIFSRTWGYDVMDVGNVYAFRSTDPSVLIGMAEAASVGAENNRYLSEMAHSADRILCAWGTRVSHHRELRVMSLLRLHGPLYCLRKTAHGHPSHPLYLPKTLLPMLLETSS